MTTPPRALRAPLLRLLDQPAVRFAIAGGFNTALGFVLFRGLLRTFGDRPTMAWVAQSIAYALCVAISYAINSTWTFRSGGGHGRQLPRFLAAHGGSLVLSSALIQIGVTTFALPFAFCWLLATAVTTVTNFVLQRFWVFPHQPPAA
ncbi:MAG TPA: GtrA family protein [Gemmatirosa sp.]